ncbi:MAG: hypothetical protein AB7V48_16175 [Sedimentibacter sp.]
MIQQELKILIKANQVKEIDLIGKLIDADGNYSYSVNIVTEIDNMDTILKTGRTGTVKTYTSADRAIKGMQSLGYSGKFSVFFEQKPIY